MRAIPELAAVKAAYDTLADLAWDSRYEASLNFSEPRLAAEVNLACDLLDEVRDAILPVLAAMGIN